MKKLLILIFATVCLYAEATFDQVQSMIDKQQYKQAVLALTIIEKNHPGSSKVQFTLAQAQAGLGNLPLAKEALDKAIAINPKLDFVPASQVKELYDVVNSTRIIKRVDESANWALWILLMVGVSFIIAYFRRSKPKPESPTPEYKYEPSPKPYSPNSETTRADPVISDLNIASTSGLNKSYNKPTEVHHHHTTNNNNSSNILATVAAAGLTSAAVSMAMDHYHDESHEQPTHSYEPEPNLSSSWNDSSSTSSSWDNDLSSSSSTWSSSSDSSSSDSWSSSSDSSSSSWND